MKRRTKIWLSLLLCVVLLAGGISYWQYNHTNQMHHDMGANQMHHDMGTHDPNAIPVTKLVAPETNAPVKTFNLTAEVTKLDLGHGKTMTAWTFNGTAPGPEIRVQQGDRVVVHLTNKLPVGVTIHWHGVHVPASQDGVAGITQDAVKPGETFTYSFIADQPGTYWYHSHQDSATQVGRGLYGAFIVEPKKETVHVDRDYTITLHEWMTGNQPDENKNSNEMAGDHGANTMNPSDRHMGVEQPSDMNKPSMVPNAKQEMALLDMISMYDVYTANSTSEGLHFDAKPGEWVRLRLINAGNMTHLVTVGAPFQVIALDGHDINGATTISQTLLPIGGGQRYDLVFRMPQNGSVKLVDADPSARERQMISATFGNGSSVQMDGNPMEYPWFDFSKYGSPKADTTMNTNPTVQYDMKLDAATINGKVGHDLPPIEVNKGDIVKVHMTNESTLIHPMHLHGHMFRVLTRNGKPLTGSPIYLDTLNVLPGESYDIVFEANNPGLWMFHCHNLYHAAGMCVMVNYKGISTPFSEGGPAGNKPE
ncbi:copper oxidase [Collibacillus ludicampi]|uniref:Copper oxidase n=1 Tax=Collibacillus ludicampi TaxID=2771369 RepID=A0AAV4LFG9_9BACL|nr:multicopper oxidase family protein [Collibacillus ludicampi]GIM46197.1 copper oxidase [Collibacillus ludicampi]